MSTPVLSTTLNDFGHRPAGALQVLDVGGYTFEAGGALPQVEIAYETWGRLNAAGDNAVLVAHALTGDSHVAATEADPSTGWWEELVGPGRPLDTDRWFVIAPAMVGGCYGSTGPASPDPDGRPWGSRFPFVTIRDTVCLEERLLRALGVTRLHAVIGGSMGGARSLEWAATFPDWVDGVGVFACGAASTAEQIAFGQAQVQAIENDPDFAGGDYYDGAAPLQGLALARRIAHITYRSEYELGVRFGREAQPGEEPLGWAQRRRGRYQVESYLDHQAKKLISRFDPNAYLVVAEALISHDVGRGRGGVAQALAGVSAKPLLVAVDSDRLYLPSQSEELARLIPGENTVHMISSPIGHDGFLTSAQQLGTEIREVLRL
ncbi:homoserine O-acetyltransferase MetX [Nesterenkonia aerolata]|uniref:Homoserine O-acetyltransferase n=1 Tax=Nesterenkonia aerolata TaxID=3074079 RepID=A0ABU2DNX6_9MICC|nr:homoserine O-acetyltransferase [Nesterenkonia sp. LY-0111]MDR8018227.1 homoserine O-acetyltransferase [Nesterenkonia sp. LY-0111]